MNILITSIGSMSSEAVIASLRARGFRLTGCDINPKEWLYPAQLTDAFYQVPYGNDGGYIDSILAICESQNIDYIIPLTDVEIDVFSENISVFNLRGIKVCISCVETITICRNKMLFYDLLKDKQDINIIPTYSYSQFKIFDKIEYPVIAKPKKGRSSEGLLLAKNKESIDAIIGDKNEYVFQPYIKGDIYTVDFAVDMFGNYVYTSRKELIRSANGAGLTVELKDNAITGEMISVLVKKMTFLGCLNAEFIYDGANYFLMDINPRFSAGIAFSQMTGYDFVYNHLKCFMQDKIDDSVTYNPMIINKRFVEFKI